MHKHDVITFPGPGGSSVSCCIVPCGCIMVLLVSLLLGSVGLFLRTRSGSHAPQVALSGAPAAHRAAAIARR
jgi:hypothetical protein